MKKTLLYFWNLFFDLKILLVDGLFAVKDFFMRRLYKKPHILSVEDTINYILKTKCSVSRYGDAEIKLVAGTDVCYQDASSLLISKLQQVLCSDEDRLLVCLPNVFESLSHMTEDDGLYWGKHLARYRKYWYKYTLKNKLYGNAFISRVYMCFNEKEKAQDYFNALKKIWNDRDIVLVEGEKSRLGVGNDLFENARSIRRILGPSAFAFSRYEELLAEARKLEKAVLIILAMGPVGSVMPYDLLDDGYQAVDLGNIDTEYEWFLRGSTMKTPIENKMVYEAGAGQDVGELDDETYQSQIIARVTG